MTLVGLRVARLKVLFELPSLYGDYPHPLAYIEWYTPFGPQDPVTSMYTVKRSTRNRRPNAAIVSIDRIVGPCHLVSKCGQTIDRTLGVSSTLDRAEMFYVNPYFTIDIFMSSSLYKNTY